MTPSFSVISVINKRERLNTSYILKLILLLISFSILSEISAKPLSKIKIIDKKFYNQESERFFPWGFNYTNPEKVDLIEDNWYNNKSWKVIASDFKEMRILGTNVVRIHLQYHQFMDDPVTPNKKALNRLERLVQIAEKNRLYLLVTGLGAYRKEDQPEWYINMDDSERWNTQKIFWKSIAGKIGKYPSVFAYDLMNEPVVSVGCKVANECCWTHGEPFGDYYFVQNISRDPKNKFHDTVERWISEISESIRTEDRKTLITVGFLNLGTLTSFSEHLDFISTHIYPKTGEIEKSVNFVNKNQSSVPLVITESFTLLCNSEELKEFITDIDGKYEGLIGHYFGKMPEEYDANSLENILIKAAIEFFVDNKPDKK